MKKKNDFLIFLLALIGAVQATWAQTTVTTEDELRTAVQSNRTVRLENDITLNNGRLVINSTTVTLDLNGHTLRRQMTAADADGQVIYIMQEEVTMPNGQLTIRDSSDGDGEISGGWALQGGGIYVGSGCSLTLNGGTIHSNRAGQISGAYGTGGGIENHGRLIISGGSISYNTAGQYGGGVYNAEGATFIMTGGFIDFNTAATGGGIYHVGTNNGSLNMRGNPVVDNNNFDDLYLASGQLITVTGVLSEEAHIGVSASETGIFTTGYSNYNTASPDTYFSFDSSSMDAIVALKNGEACITQYFDYVERAWDGEKVTETNKICSDFTAINGNNTSDDGWLDLYNGWYVVTDDSEYKTLNVQGTDVHLIIPDDVTLTVTGGVKLEEGYKLTIYGQNDDSGQLIATNSHYNGAAIGSGESEGGEWRAGELVVHGGTINATGGSNGAGIGGGQGFNDNGNDGGSFTLYGGTVTAQGGRNAAGVGGGGGYQANYHGGAGGRVRIYGGTLRATGGYRGAGIGSGEQADKVGWDAVDLKVFGGRVIAQGGDNAAGIGGGEDKCGGNVEVSGGEVHATGGQYGAGIGGGENSSGGRFRITGGMVIAKGAPGAAGIGGGDGEFGYGGKNYILGGIVIAEAGTQGGVRNRAIGPGDNIEWGADASLEEENRFYLELGDAMQVSAGNEGSNNLTHFSAGERMDACMYRSYARIEPCTHSGSTFNIVDGTSHHIGCSYCMVGAGNQTETHVFASDGKCVCGLLGLSDNADNTTILSTWNNEALPVALTGRTLYKDGSWNTLCLPFDVTTTSGPLAGDNVKAMTLNTETSELNGNTLTLNFDDAPTSIPAGTPFIIKWDGDGTANIVEPVFENVSICNETNDATIDDVLTFTGTYAPVGIDSNGDNTKLYLGSDNTLYYPNAAMTIGCQRAYFQLAEGLIAGEAAQTGHANQISNFLLNFGEGEATGILSIDHSPLTIDHSSDAWYTLDGRRLNGKPTQKGIYINNGRKVVNK